MVSAAAACRGIMSTVSDPDLEAAWSAVHDALRPGWSAVRPVRYDEERERPWHVVAFDWRTSSKRHDRVEATGRTEAEALRDLAELLQRWRVEEAPERRA
jgi:hypothetical protein